MSEPETMDCGAAANRLYEYLDGELSPAAEAGVRAHLAACAHCFGLFDFETAYLRFLEARTRARGAPPHLRQRILDELLFDPEPPPRP
ncbi:MAG TPA: zf-HC2 domain-containing protein [Gemmatimonadales bacterium]|jgi:anti-sigma factor (TIGR02949 family)